MQKYLCRMLSRIKWFSHRQPARVACDWPLLPYSFRTDYFQAPVDLFKVGKVGHQHLRALKRFTRT